MENMKPAGSILSTFFLTLISAYAASIVSCILFSIPMQNMALGALSPVAAMIGVMFASPLLLCVYMPWFEMNKESNRITTWTALPTIAALIYGIAIGFLFFKNDHTYMMFVMGIFTFTGFLTSIFMWMFHTKILKNSNQKENNQLGENK